MSEMTRTWTGVGAEAHFFKVG